jgi:hypothetical protein
LGGGASRRQGVRRCGLHVGMVRRRVSGRARGHCGRRLWRRPGPLGLPPRRREGKGGNQLDLKIPRGDP